MEIAPTITIPFNPPSYFCKVPSATLLYMVKKNNFLIKVGFQIYRKVLNLISQLTISSSHPRAFRLHVQENVRFVSNYSPQPFNFSRLYIPSKSYSTYHCLVLRWMSLSFLIFILSYFLIKLPKKVSDSFIIVPITS